MRRLGTYASVLLVAFALVACGGGSSNKAKTPAAVDMRGRKAVDVDAKNNQFTPSEIIVSPGTTVTWHNQDAVPHNVEPNSATIDFGAPFGVASDKFGPGATYSFTFNKVGEDFYYTCTIHSLMNGHVRVESGGTTPTTAAP